MFWPTSAWSPTRATRCRGTACCCSSSTSGRTPPRTSSRTSPSRRTWRARPSAPRREGRQGGRLLRAHAPPPPPRGLPQTREGPGALRHHRGALPEPRLAARRHGARAPDGQRGRRAGGGRRGGAPDALHHPLGQGARVEHGVRDLAGGRSLPLVPEPARRRRDRGGAPAPLRRRHARQGAPLPELPDRHLRPQLGHGPGSALALPGRPPRGGARRPPGRGRGRLPLVSLERNLPATRVLAEPVRVAARLVLAVAVLLGPVALGAHLAHAQDDEGYEDG